MKSAALKIFLSMAFAIIFAAAVSSAESSSDEITLIEQLAAKKQQYQAEDEEEEEDTDEISELETEAATEDAEMDEISELETEEKDNGSWFSFSRRRRRRRRSIFSRRRRSVVAPPPPPPFTSNGDTTLTQSTLNQLVSQNLVFTVGGASSGTDGLSNFNMPTSSSGNSGTCPNYRVIDGWCNNEANKNWGRATYEMPRGVTSSQSTTAAGSANVYDPTRWDDFGGQNSWGGSNLDPRSVSDFACTDAASNGSSGGDTSADGGSAVPNDAVRSDSVITYAQVMDHELDASDPTEFGSTASDSGTEYSFGVEGNGVYGSFKRSQDALKNGITSAVDAGIVYGESDNERNRLRNGNGLKYSCLEQTSNLGTGTCAVNKQYLPVSAQICGNAINGNPRATCFATEFFMANPTFRSCFYAGDFRANENPALLAYHTLFARMHNHLSSSGCTCSSFDSPSSCQFESIRHRVGYEEQYITYSEWLPAYTGLFSSGSYAKVAGSGSTVLSQSSSGIGGMPNYSHYDPNIRLDVRHVFASATFRQHTGVNHVMALESGGSLELDQTYFESCVWFDNQGPGCLSGSGYMWDDDGSEHDEDPTTNTPRVAYSGSSPDTDTTSVGVKHLCDILVGQVTQASKRGDTVMVTEERNQLFYKANNGGNNDEGLAGGFEGYGGDLAALNIFRGRDHNIAGYSDAFAAYFGAGRGPSSPSGIHTYSGTGSGSSGSVDLSNAYSAMSQVDLWVGALGEAKISNTGSGNGVSMLGTVLSFDVVTQFRDLRDGDRFWYQNSQLASYGAPATCASLGGVSDMKGLKYWMEELTDASISGSDNIFKIHDAECNHYGETKDHSGFAYSSLHECGSAGGYSGSGGGAVISRMAPANNPMD